MIWTYRVFHNVDGYCVRVVYFERDGTLIGYQKTPAAPTGRTAEELAQDLRWFQEAFALPILTMAELDAQLALQPPKPKKQSGKRKTIEQLMAEFEEKEDGPQQTKAPSLELIAAD
jgi:hypothetical protein